MFNGRSLSHYWKKIKWFNRDRFLAGAGHGSMLIYAMLHLTGWFVDGRDKKLSPASFKNAQRKIYDAGRQGWQDPLGQEHQQRRNGDGGSTRYSAVLIRKVSRCQSSYLLHLLGGDLMENFLAVRSTSLAGNLKLSNLIYSATTTISRLKAAAEFDVNETRPGVFLKRQAGTFKWLKTATI